jgi:hypothetical protein
LPHRRASAKAQPTMVIVLRQRQAGAALIDPIL